MRITAVDYLNSVRGYYFDSICLKDWFEDSKRGMSDYMRNHLLIPLKEIFFTSLWFITFEKLVLFW